MATRKAIIFSINLVHQWVLAVLSLQSIPLRLLPCLDRSGAAEVDESAVGKFLYPYHSAYGYLFVSLLKSYSL